MRTVLLICINLIINGFIMGQNLDSLLIYIPNDEKLEEILSSFIKNESKEEDIDTSHIFRMIIFNSPDSSLTIHIISGSNKKDIFKNFERNINQEQFFLITYNNFYWFTVLRGNNLDTTLFKKTEKFYRFFYYQDKSISRPIIIDDTYMPTCWTYVFKDKKLIEISKIQKFKN